MTKFFKLKYKTLLLLCLLAGFFAFAAGFTPTVNAAPSLSASAVSSSQINLSWSGGYPYYYLQRGSSFIWNGTATSYSNTGLSPSTTYSYIVAAWTGSTWVWSNWASATTQAAPDNHPPSVSSSMSPSSPTTANTVTFSGSASDSQSGVNSLWIFVDGAFVKSCPGASCSYTGGPYSAGGHNYEIRAKDNANNWGSAGVKGFNVSSACVPNVGTACNRNACGGTGTIQCNGSCSAPAPPLYGTASCGGNACGSGNTNNCTGACDSPSPPSVPGNLGTACNRNACGGTGTIQCNGTCSAPAPTLYGTAACNPNACGTYGGTTNNCTGACSGGVPATPYTVGTACNRNACGGTGTITNACTGSCSAPAPSCTPPTLSATAVSSSQINLSWSGGYSSYYLQRGSSFIWNGTATSYSNTGLSPSTTYSYIVAAWGGSDWVWSNWASATTQSASLTALSGWVWLGVDNCANDTSVAPHSCTEFDSPNNRQTEPPGWVSLNCNDAGAGGCATSNYKVSIDADGNLSGYAWSDSVGWISFENADVNSCPDAPPASNCQPKWDSATGKVSGWARILSIKDAAAVGNSGGWQGWVKLRDESWGSNSFGVNTTGAIPNFAYAGTDELGWLSFTPSVVNGTGTISVTSNIAGASFTLTGPATYSGSGISWSKTDATAPGNYEITWNPVSGYTTPAKSTQFLNINGTISFSGTYTAATGTVNVTSTPSPAPFTLTGPSPFTGNTPYTNASASIGAYTVAWNALSCYSTPSGSTQNLASGGTINFNETYSQLAPTAAPTLSYGSVTHNSAVLSWNSVSCATAYYLYKFSPAGDVYVGPALSHTDSTLSPSSPYSYKVAACNSAGCGPDSNNISFVTLAPPNTSPAAVNLTAVQPDYCSSGPSAILSWTFSDPDAGSSQSAYQVQIATDASFTSIIRDTGKLISSSGSYATPAGTLNYNQTYYWRVMVWDNYNTPSGWTGGPNFSTPVHAYPTANFTYLPSSPMVGQNITFTDTSIAFGGATITTRNWDFCKGATCPSKTTSGTPATHTYTVKSNYTVELVVSDSTPPGQGGPFTCPTTKVLNLTKSLLSPGWKEVIPK